MVLTLYGFVTSTCTKRVATILHEKNIPFKFVNVNFAEGEHKTPGYRAKQPFGQVPYIDDDGFILYESRAIARYLEEKYPNQGTKLIPAELHKRALFEQAASNELSNFDAFAAPLVFEVLIKSRYGGKAEQAKVDELTTRLTAKVDIYEEILSKQKYLGGDEVTLADLFHLPYGSMLPLAGFKLTEGRPNVERWLGELQSRASWQALKEGVKATA